MKTLLCACLLFLAAAVPARGQVHLTLDQNTLIKSTALTPANSDTIIDGLNAHASPGKQFDPRLIPGGGSGGGGSSYGAVGSYPVFVLDLGPGYYDVELKGTITNFLGQQELVYWTATAIDNQPSYYAWDAAPTIFLTGQYGGVDPRTYHKANHTQSLYEQVGGPNHRLGKIIIIPSHVTGYASWMYLNNPKVVWVYTRISATNFETDGNGAVVWTPVRPVEWLTAPLNP